MQKKSLRRQFTLIKNLSLSECSLRQCFLKLKTKPEVSSKRYASRIRYSVAVSRRATNKMKFKFSAKLSYKIVSPNRTATLPSDTTPTHHLREMRNKSMKCKWSPKARKICLKLVLKSSRSKRLITNKAFSSTMSKLLRSLSSSSSIHHRLWLKQPCFLVQCLESTLLLLKVRHQRFLRRISTPAPWSTLCK